MTTEEKHKRLKRHPALIKCDLMVLKNEVIKLQDNCEWVEDIEPITKEILELLLKIEELIL
jgi:hypothetical protein